MKFILVININIFNTISSKIQKNTNRYINFYYNKKIILQKTILNLKKIKISKK